MATKASITYMLSALLVIVGSYYIGQYAAGGYSPHFALLYAIGHAVMLVILRMNGQSIESLKLKASVSLFLSAFNLAATILGFCMTDFAALTSDAMEIGMGHRREVAILPEEGGVIYLVQGILFIIAAAALYSGAGFEQSYDVAAFEADELHVTKVMQSTLGAGMSFIFGMTAVSVYIDARATPISGLYVAIGSLVVVILCLRGFTSGDFAAAHQKDLPTKFWVAAWIGFAIAYFLAVDYSALELNGAAIDSEDASVLILIEGVFLLAMGLAAQFFPCYFNAFHFDFSNADAPAKASIELLSKYLFSQVASFAGSVLIAVYLAVFEAVGASTMPARIALFFTLANAMWFAVSFFAARSGDLVSSAFMKPSVVMLHTAGAAVWTIVGFLMTDFDGISESHGSIQETGSMLDNDAVKYITLVVGIINVLVGIIAFGNPANWQAKMFSAPATAATNTMWGWVLSSGAAFSGLLLIGVAYNDVYSARFIGVLALATVFNIDTWVSAINSGDAAKMGAKNVNSMTLFGMIIAVLWFLGTDFTDVNADTGAVFSVVVVYYFLAQRRG